MNRASIASNIADQCPYVKDIRGYVDCTLDDLQATLIEEHLSDCNSCAAALARTVESGVVPNWLPKLVNTARDSSDSVAESLNSPTAKSIDSESPPERYQRIRLHGEGGMGQVWQGWDAVMKRPVALKQLRSDRHNAERSHRLLQEATSLARLSHPNIVTVHEVLELNERPTLVMEFIDGLSLENFSRRFVMSERQAAKILEQLADALAHAHERGVIHRDLKPGNVLLSWPSKSNGLPSNVDNIESAIPKLTDFGLAKSIASDDLTRTGDLLGTPAYMAPEQTIGLAGVAGPSADIYGLGAILYDLLTGKPPHLAENPIATIMLVREQEPATPRILRPELSKDIETICLKCLRKIPKDRYANACDLRNDLRAYLEGRPISARPLGNLRAALHWSLRHKSFVASAILATSLLLTVILGSLWTAAKERQLRIEADEAREDAKRSEQRFIAEAERANHALDVNRQHFEVALDRVNRLANLAYNPRNKPLSTLDFGQEIQQATTDIYATYLDTLPAPEQWTLDEAYAVTDYIKYMTALGSSAVAAPWLDRMKSVATRLETVGPDSPKMRQFLAQHYYNLQIHAYAAGDFISSGRYGEQSGRFVDVDARQAAFVLMNSAIAYNRAAGYEDAVRAANQSVEAYQTAMREPNPKPDDEVNFLDNLRWHRQIARDAGNNVAVDQFVTAFQTLAAKFDKTSPHYARVQEIIRAFDSLAR